MPAREGLDVEDEAGPMLKAKKRWVSALPYFTTGDIDAFCAVFANNLAVMLAGAQMLAPHLGDEIVYGRIVPGVGVSMAFGCLWYVVQAQLKAEATGRTDLCSQPFGINTPGVFAFNANIILHAFFAHHGTKGDAARLAWRAGVVANLLQGLLEIALAVVGPYISEAVPLVSSLGSLASVGLAFLFTGVLQSCISWPMITLPGMFLLFMALFAKVAVPKVPSTLSPVIAGASLAWLTGKATAAGVWDASAQVGWHPPGLALDAFGGATGVAQYVGVALPVALTVSVGTIQCRQLAASAGDGYSLRWSMLGDGLATVLAALFGSPWGMTVYIGHPAFKTMGAKIGYNLASGFGFLLVCFSGLGAVVLAIFTGPTLNLVILFVGLAVCVEALDTTPARHRPALLVALVPGFCNWCIAQCESFARVACSQRALSPHDNTSHTTSALNIPAADCAAPSLWASDPSLRGVYALGQGYLLASISLSAMLVHVIDRRFLRAAHCAVTTAVMSSCGLVHSEVLFLPWVGPPNAEGGLHIQFVSGYLLVGLVFLIGWMSQRWGYVRCGPEP